MKAKFRELHFTRRSTLRKIGEFYPSDHGRQPTGRGGGASPRRLMGMCNWMGSHFNDWFDYCGVAFSIELL